MDVNLMLGNCLGEMSKLADNSVDAVVTDPPYGLSFMGKKWDYSVPSVDIWREAFRVLKPGGHILSFGGTRTYHRMVVNIEDAGFEIRDQVMWIYGSGFPKSTDVSKRIDKEAGVQGEVFIDEDFIRRNPGKLRDGIDRKKEYSGTEFKEGIEGGTRFKPATPEAKQWSGWGTALKPANEPICLARKPLEKGLTVAENVLKYGTGAINVDECRIGFANEKDAKEGRSSRPSKTSNANEYALNHGGLEGFDRSNRDNIQGRWPANLILDETAAEMLDAQSGPCKTGGRSIKTKCGEAFYRVNVDTILPIDNGSGASRFFYVAKASKRERNAGLEGMPEKHIGTYAQDEWSRNNMGNTPDNKREPVQNFHPTVKPIKLMEYLIRLITPPNGVVLDPFMGSGTTGIAAKNLGFQFIGIELNEEYLEIAKKRIGEL